MMVAGCVEAAGSATETTVDEDAAKVCAAVDLALDGIGWGDLLAPAQCEAQTDETAAVDTLSPAFVLRFQDYGEPLIANITSPGASDRLRLHLEVFPFFLLATAFDLGEVQPNRFEVIFFVHDLGEGQVVYEINPADIEEPISADTEQEAMEVLADLINRVTITS